MPNLIAKRFVELRDEMKTLEQGKTYRISSFTSAREEHVDSNLLLAWKVKAKNLLVKACGETSQHFKEFVDSEHSTYSTNYSDLQRMGAVFLAAKEDFEGGYLSSVRPLCKQRCLTQNLSRQRNCCGSIITFLLP